MILGCDGVSVKEGEGGNGSRGKAKAVALGVSEMGQNHSIVSVQKYSGRGTFPAR